MSLTINDYIQAAQQTTRIHIAKIQILDNNENVLEEITDDLISGDITLTNQFGSRRNANIVLKNDTGKYIPAYRGSLWLNKKCRIYSGLNINGEDYFVNKGIYVISEVQTVSDFANKYVNISLLDKFSLLDGTIAGALKAPYIIPVSTNIESVVRSIFTDAGEVKIPIIQSTTITTPYTITKEQGSSYSELLKDLANMLSWTCYFDNNGIPRFESPTDENKSASVWDYSTDEITYLGVNHRYKFDSVKNSIYVYGDNINGSLYKANSQDNYVFSTTRVSLIGERILVINDNLIYSTQLCQDRSDYELKKAIILQESVDLQSIPIDIINEGDIITILDTFAGLNKDRYLVNSINFPLLSNGNMTLNCWKIRPIS